MAVFRLLVTRILWGVVCLWVISVLIFSATELLPGDLASVVFGQSKTPEAVAALREELGLDRPPQERYIEWLAAAARFDFGRSLATQRPISQLIIKRLQRTLLLALTTACMAVPLALIIGMLCTLWRDGPFDRAVNAAAIIVISPPEFFTGYFLAFFFAVKLGWFPAVMLTTPSMSFAEVVHAIFLPCLTLLFACFGHMMRLTRAALISVLEDPYIETARLKGLSNRRILLVHALPNAVAPIANVIVINLAYLIVGVIVVETVFNYPGLGKLMVDAISSRDIPVIQACSLIFATTYIMLNLTADLISLLANPKLRHAVAS